MKIIDSDNYATAGIETMFFPGGEPHVKLPKFPDDVLFVGKLRSWNDVGFAALVLNALQRQYRVGARLHVFLPYFPGARQDRSDGSAPHTLNLMTRLLDVYQAFTHVFDGHSSVLTGRGDTRNLFWTDFGHGSTVRVVAGVIAPDAGALSRATLYRDYFHPASALLCATKHRDPQTGHLHGYRLPSLPKRGHYIIVDDICDGGGTFNLLMEAALKDPLGESCTFELVVSHGIFSKGLDALHPRIAHITTTDSWCRLPNSDRLTVLKLDKLFPLITETNNNV